MKKVLIPVICLLLALLCACEKTPRPAAESTSVPDASSAAEAESASDAQGSDARSKTAFAYLKGDLPKGWTISDVYSTETYLEAHYGEEENAPRLTVSTMTYNDDMGADKTKILAEKVHERESENASDVETLKIGGLDFYHLSYNSLLTEKMRCYVFFGQTVPDKNKEYHFVEIQIDNIKDAKQYDALKNVLDQLEFNF